MQLTFNSNALARQRQISNGTIAPGGTFAEGLFSELSPPYYSLIKAGMVFSLASAALSAVTAFTGAAAGTPLLGMYNPAGSGVDIVLLQTKLGVRSTGTTAGTAGIDYFLGQQGSTPVTGTQTVARNLYTGAQGGSVAYCMVNTVNTAAVASNFIAPAFSLGNITATAGVNVATLVDDIKGAIIISPGNYLALGSYVTMAAAALDLALLWAELPA